MARASKDRTGLFVNLPEFVITPETGKMILHWCQSGVEINSEVIFDRIGECTSIQDLLSLYRMFPQFQESLKPEFERKKRELIMTAPPSELITPVKIIKTHSNGNH
jgi:hypothetical protein